MTNAAQAVVRFIVAILGGALVLAAAAGCSEKPQLLVPTGEPQMEPLQSDGELRERTLNQGESERMSH
jgi:hypothetical protein